MRRLRLGEMLVLAGLLSSAQLEDAISRARTAGKRLGQFLIHEGIVRESDVVRSLSEQLRISMFRTDDYPIDHELAKLIPPQMANRNRIVPLRKQSGLLTVATPDPTDILAMDAVQETVQMEVEPVICTETQFEELIGSLYGAALKTGAAADEIEDVEYGIEPDASEDESGGESEIRQLMDAAEGQTAIRTVNWILTQAIREKASDIHISPEKTHVRIRLRVDGELKDVPSLPKTLQYSVASRLKILGKMDIATSRTPQDGRFSARVGGREIHVRISSMPTIHGENIVMRLLDMNALVYKLDHLGMMDADRERVERALQRPHGLILSTGPTGSGKSTSLYSLLAILNQPNVNIVTVEDPVEFRVERIRQVELNARAGMTFASALRAILRQDPDVIMVGEIRDLETAAICMQAALTGHLVLSTMHTNDAVGTVTRLKDMGVDPFLVSSVLAAVIAQRLLRKVCPQCGEAYDPPPEALAFWGIDRPQSDDRFMRARGCHKCRQSGYRGRLGIFEILIVNEAVQKAILHDQSEAEIAAIARDETGFRTLKQDAADKIRAGLTTMEEGAAFVAG